MRIRYYRQGDIPTLAHIQQLAAQADNVDSMSIVDFEEWLHAARTTRWIECLSYH